MSNEGASTKTQAEPIRVLLVDDHEHVLWGLSKLIDGEWPRMMVIGMSRDMTNAKELIEARSPDVVVLDMNVAGESALDAMPALLARARSEVIVHTATRDAAMRERAMLAGARCVVDKEAPAETLLREIERVHREHVGTRAG